MNRLLQNTPLNYFLILCSLILYFSACQHNPSKLDPILLDNLERLEIHEFIVPASYQEELFYQGELISETHGEGYLISAGPYYFIENGRIAYFPEELEIRIRNYVIIQEQIFNYTDQIPEIDSAIDFPPGYNTIANSIGYLFKSSLLNINKDGENINFDPISIGETEKTLAFTQVSSPYPLKQHGTFFISNSDLLSKLEVEDYSPFSQIFWEFLSEYDFSKFSLHFTNQEERLVLQKAVCNYSKNGFNHRIEMNFGEFKPISKDFLDQHYNSIVTNSMNPFVKVNQDFSETHSRRASNYYFMDTDSTKFTPRDQKIDINTFDQLVLKIKDEID